MAAGLNGDLQLEALQFGDGSLACHWSLALRVIHPAPGDVDIDPLTFAPVKGASNVSDVHALHRFPVD